MGFCFFFLGVDLYFRDVCDSCWFEHGNFVVDLTLTWLCGLVCHSAGASYQVNQFMAAGARTGRRGGRRGAESAARSC